ncbi:SDR family oxidoreductase [Paraburkholderia domus]|uniref:SDR family oxidoreductase n=1 Tax=Paraburkholderia domus TaxID=2793075 RepID=UPI001F34FC92|nr:SDR family oxidoreductase [Paraburkholderia domus]
MEELEPTAHEIASTYGVRVLPIGADVTNVNDVRGATTLASDHFDQVNILVNDAGAAIQRRDREITGDDSDWLNQIEIKCLGALRIIREFLPLIPADGTGRIRGWANLLYALAACARFWHGRVGTPHSRVLSES